MELKQSINYVKKHKLQIFVPIILVALFLACFFNVFCYIAIGFAIALISISNFSEIIYYILFVQMFSAIGKFSVTCTFFGAALLCVKYIVGLIKKTEKFYKIPFILTCVICFLGSIHFNEIDAEGVYQGFSLIAALFLIYLLFVYRDKFKIKKCADYLVYGIIVSLAMSLLLMLFKGEHISISHPFNENLTRLKLLNDNENSLAIYCSLSLSIYVSTILSTRKDLLKNIIFGVLTLCIGLFTLSKCFLIICSFIILYLLVMLILKYKKQSLKIVLPILGLLCIIGFALHSRIFTIFERFFISFDEKLSLSTLTTGRSDLWTMYINEIRSSISNMVIGVGFFNKRVIGMGPHNLLIHLLYRMGFVGIIMLCILGFYYYQCSSKQHKLNFKNCLPLIVFILISMVENFL